MDFKFGTQTTADGDGERNMLQFDTSLAFEKQAEGACCKLEEDFPWHRTRRLAKRG